MANLTKKALAASVMKLLESKPLDKITIKDITDECGVTRNTFYYHFQDIYDLCSWIFISRAEEIMNAHIDEEQWEKGFLTGLEYLYEHKRMIYHVRRSISKEALDRYLDGVVVKYTLKFVRIKAREMNVCEAAQKTIAEFYKNAFIGKVLQWIDEGMDTPPEKLATLCNNIFRGTVVNALLSADEVLR